MEQASNAASTQDPEDGAYTATYPRALAIPEILKRVFELMDRPTGATALRVSRDWFNVGLEARWYQLDCFLPLMELLAPIFYDTNERAWTFVTSVGNADWTRFRRYADCVRVLEQDCSSAYRGLVPSCLPYDELAGVVFHHPFGTSLMPRLERLIWVNGRYASPLHVIPFLSATLKHLALHLTHPTDDDGDDSGATGFEPIQQTLRAIKRRAPNVQTFELDADIPMDFLVPSLLDGVLYSRCLTSILLSPFCQTRELVRALSTLPNLQKIEVLDDPDRIDDVRINQFAFVKDGFEDLRQVCMESSFEQATETFQSLFVPKLLELVCLHHANYTSLDPLPEYFTALTQACSNLTEVGLCLYTNDWRAERAGPLTFNLFRPLLDCHQLTSLWVKHNHAMLLEDSEVDEMGLAWRELRSLSLCLVPSAEIVGDDLLAGNHITIVRHIAKALPLLEDLGLYFNSGPIPDNMLHDIPEAQFKALDTLQVGTSRVPGDDPLATGIFLESLCAGALPSIERMDDRASLERKAELQRWDEVVRTCRLVRDRVNNSRRMTL